MSQEQALALVESILVLIEALKTAVEQQDEDWYYNRAWQMADEQVNVLKVLRDRIQDWSPNAT